MTDLSNAPWNEFPADAAPDDQVSKNFHLDELAKSDIASRLWIPNNFASAAELHCAVYLCRDVMQRENLHRPVNSNVFDIFNP